MEAAKTRTKANTGFHLPRMQGQLWGTTTPGDVLAVVNSITHPSTLVKGPEIREYEQAFARQVGTRRAVSFSSGRVAFYALLKGLGIGEGDEVLMQVPSHIVVANAIRYTGAKPVFVDCQLNTFNMDLKKAEECITPRTRALLIQHTFGIPVDLDAAVDLARRRNLILIEDCVHALGATYGGKQIGSFGRAAFFSTEETKIISSTMGGMAVTDDEQLAADLEAFQQACEWPTPSVTARYLGKLAFYYMFTHPYLHRYTRPVYLYLRRYPAAHMAPGATGINERSGGKPSHYEMRLSNGQARIAVRQLSRLNENLAARRRNAALYRERLAELGFNQVTPPAGSEPSWVRYPVLVRDRELAFRTTLPYAQLGRWFDTVLEESSTPAAGGYVMGSCPNAELAATHLANVPTHPRVTPGDIERIVESLRGMNWTSA